MVTVSVLQAHPGQLPQRQLQHIAQLLQQPKELVQQQQQHAARVQQ